MTIAEYHSRPTFHGYGYVTVDNLIDMMGAGWLLTDLRPAPLREAPMIYATLMRDSDMVIILVMEDGTIGDVLAELI
jgi:hypothetical protein